jgi:hypothetical protein
MKWAIVGSIVFLAGIAGAHADAIVQERYYDLIRPHGHPRSAEVHNADLDYCYAQTGAIRGLADTPEFKECMLGRGYRWQQTRVFGHPPDVPPPGPFDSGCPAFGC